MSRQNRRPVDRRCFHSAGSSAPWSVGLIATVEVLPGCHLGETVKPALRFRRSECATRSRAGQNAGHHPHSMLNPSPRVGANPLSCRGRSPGLRRVQSGPYVARPSPRPLRPGPVWQLPWLRAPHHEPRHHATAPLIRPTAPRLGLPGDVPLRRGGVPTPPPARAGRRSWPRPRHSSAKSWLRGWRTALALSLSPRPFGRSESRRSICRGGLPEQVKDSYGRPCFQIYSDWSRFLCFLLCQRLSKSQTPFPVSRREKKGDVTGNRSELPDERHEEDRHDEEPDHAGQTELPVVAELVAGGPHHHQVDGCCHRREERCRRGDTNAHQHRPR